MIISFDELTSPDGDTCKTIERWENDPELVPFIRPNRSQEELEKHNAVTVESLKERLVGLSTYLVYVDEQLVGRVDFKIDPDYLFSKITGTAWIGILIGEASARGIGVGAQAMRYLEEQIKNQGLKRIELGVFEFNTRAVHFYKSLGYQEIGRIEEFTYWQGKMWSDIRLEKYLE